MNRFQLKTTTEGSQWAETNGSASWWTLYFSRYGKAVLLTQVLAIGNMPNEYWYPPKFWVAA